MGVSKNIIAFLNFIAVLASIAIIVTGTWLALNPDNNCIRNNYYWSLVPLGILVLLVSLAGFVGTYWNVKVLLVLYLFSMALLIALLLILLIFAFVVTIPDGTYQVPGTAYDESRLDGFSSWLRSYITSSGSWAKIKSCLAESDVCIMLPQQYINTAHQFFSSHLSLLQSGCCKPPMVCGYRYVNLITWQNPANPTADPDCYMWRNDQNQLCYNCNACKAGLLGNVRKEWREANIPLIVAVVVLICVYVMIAYSAFMNAQKKNAQIEDTYPCVNIVP